jgi:hypothetical protein
MSHLMIATMAAKKKYWQTAEQCMKKHVAAIQNDGRGKHEIGTRYAWCGSTLKTGTSAARTTYLNKRLSLDSGDNYLDARRNHIYFVTRLKDNADYSVVENRPVPQNRNILADQLIRFNGYYACKKCPHILRKVVVWDKENNRQIVLLTNHLEFGATTISAIYKDRWQIELFFKALKQNLKVKTFVGTSENALYIQIWTALIAILLIKYLQFKSTFAWSLSNLVAFLHWNLFTYRDLWEWIDDPFDTLPVAPKPVQHLLPFKGLGQHILNSET